MSKLLLWKEEDRESYNKLKVQSYSDNRCVCCYKPKYSKSPYCDYCYMKSIRYGNGNKVKFSIVLSHTINYQQYLHRKFFGVNAPYKYRGIAENRISNNIPKELIHTQTNILHTYLLSIFKDTSYYTPYTILTNNLKNFTSRLLYYTILYFKAKHIFKSDSHFLGQLTQMVLTHILNTAVRYGTKKQIHMNIHTDIIVEIKPKLYKSIAFKLREISIPILVSF